MIDLLMFAALAAAAPPATEAEEGNLAQYFSNNDYPREARRRREEGRVTFEVTIGTDGLVSRCTVLTSSGSESLDETTCRLAKQRLRYRPARDTQGKPTEDSQRFSLQWTLAD